ncbi:reverse transcriptase domain-containing protein [Candidatus Marithrix sp. Canyon 246]|uniref:reverse transcriptase domain-containing protein n=1 Tax=Candidatus Marithrix sp. Canyon 246 TaxID=1827136 RepID=UPI00084A0DD9|nr:reverse transcriptase domain-containing protein [Candidatus Marithrix sp. Canyon 246]
MAQFSLNLESELFTLQRQLIEANYQPGDYRLFTIYERKPRIIAAAPFRDRVVHHALINIIEPPLDKQFIYDSYACRKNKGVHKAIDRYQTWAKRYRYALKMDISKYFPSIDRILLKDKISQRIKDSNVLKLIDKIIDTAPNTGLPIGNLTSQFLANLYLDDFDHYIKEQLRIHPYLRYVDDFIILDDDKNRLHELRIQIQEYLANNHLHLHPRKRHIAPTRRGLDVLGYLVFPNHRCLRNDNGHRFFRKLRGFAKAYAQGKIDWEDFNPSVQSWIGHAKHADTYNLRAKIFYNTVFRR